MEQPSISAILTPLNYFKWKPEIIFLRRIKGIYRVIMGIEVEPNLVVEKENYFNRMDEAYGIICLSIYPKFIFHVESFSTPKEIWTKLDGLFGKQDELRGHMLEKELIYLIPSNFKTL
jgi:hypothetical protein